MIYTTHQLLIFADYLLSNQNSIISSPINGEIWKIYQLFKTYIVDNNKLHFTNINEFLEYIEQFNTLSGGCLHFTKSKYDSKDKIKSKLVWINDIGLKILQQKFNKTSNSTNTPTGQNTDQYKECTSLFEFIAKPDKTKRSLDKIDKLTIEDLTNFIQKPTTKLQLDKKRSKLNTPKLKFPEICNEKHHSTTLSTLLFKQNNNNNNNSSNSKQINLNDQYINQKLNQFKNRISTDILNCLNEKIHFLPILYNHTDLKLGDCSYLDTCHKIKTCRYLHYYTLHPTSNTTSTSSSNTNTISNTITNQESNSNANTKTTNQKSNLIEELTNLDYSLGEIFSSGFKEISQPQWINCDINQLNFSKLGKFSAIISDPAWLIHQNLPYGTFGDLELINLKINELQDEGIIFLWVTARSLDIGRQALAKWGYEIINEVIWVKLNQLKRIIVTGRTGHWLNHSKEHLLVGLKGKPNWLNLKIDLDIIISNTRETSRKPDEIYDIIDRMCGPFARKLEIFGRQHNVRPGWLTIGNQLNGINLNEPELINNLNSSTI
ncbi:IME4 [Candida pseudojiufengensis]|uniref:IME4 n=1 Tax=Candida pseudojiufengensis TaxID=497109 RepID=UPI0022250529|nr:IME4 [Candida pseudojiufengensis]KAI5960149.1 IME4 [Candida pseudojiufengensis]